MIFKDKILPEIKLQMDRHHLMFLTFTLITVFVALYFIGYIFYTAYPVFAEEGVINFITGDKWSYSENTYGIKIYILGSVVLTFVTIIMAVPISLFTAIYLAEFASRKKASAIRPFIELLVGIPSVVYGIFGLYVLEDIFRDHIDPLISNTLGIIPIFKDPVANTGDGILLASTVLAIMIIPTVISISEDALRSIPASYKEGSFALGATHWETIRNVVIPPAKSGIISAVILGIMRAIGETMAISMLMGGLYKVPNSILSGGSAMTSKILSDMGYYVAMDEPRSALFGIAAVLFAIEIGFVGAARIVGGKK